MIYALHTILEPDPGRDRRTLNTWYMGPYLVNVLSVPHNHEEKAAATVRPAS